MTSRIDLVAQNGNIGHADYLEMQERIKALAIAIPEWPTTYVYDSVDLYDDGVEFRNKGEGEFDRYQWEVAREELIAEQKRELNPPTSSLHHSQAVEIATETGLCSDGRPCGEVHEFCQDAYCEECPNEPKLHFTPEGFATIDPLADLTVSVKPTAHADNVNHPAHYQSESGIECIMAIRAQMNCDQFAAYCQGNVVKYLWRWREKGGVESLKKAKWYLYRMIAELEDE